MSLLNASGADIVIKGHTIMGDGTPFAITAGQEKSFAQDPTLRICVTNALINLQVGSQFIGGTQGDWFLDRISIGSIVFA